jgi:hypothetical protein
LNLSELVEFETNFLKILMHPNVLKILFFSVTCSYTMNSVVNTSLFQRCRLGAKACSDFLGRLNAFKTMLSITCAVSDDDMILNYQVTEASGISSISSGMMF